MTQLKGSCQLTQTKNAFVSYIFPTLQLQPLQLTTITLQSLTVRTYIINLFYFPPIGGMGGWGEGEVGKVITERK